MSEIPGSTGEHVSNARDVSINLALQTLPLAQRTHESIAQLDDEQFRDSYTEKWRSDTQTALAEARAKLDELDAMPPSGIDREQDKSTKSRVLKSKIAYLDGQLERGDEVPLENLDLSKATSQQTLDTLAWILGEMYDVDPDKHQALTPEAFGEQLLEYGWESNVEWAERHSREALSLERDARMLLAGEDVNPIEMRRIITRLNDRAVFGDDFKKASTPQEWSAVLDGAIKGRMASIKSGVVHEMKGSISYYKRDVEKWKASP